MNKIWREGVKATERERERERETKGETEGERGASLLAVGPGGSYFTQCLMPATQYIIKLAQALGSRLERRMLTHFRTQPPSNFIIFVIVDVAAGAKATDDVRAGRWSGGTEILG